MCQVRWDMQPPESAGNYAAWYQARVNSVRAREKKNKQEEFEPNEAQHKNYF